MKVLVMNSGPGNDANRPDHLAYSYLSDPYRRIKATLVRSIWNAGPPMLH
jgi:hypothetical protein